MSEKCPAGGDQPKDGPELAFMVAAIAVMVLGMLAFYFYPYPSGRHPDLLSFVALWLREILILGFVFVALVGLALSRLRRAIQSEHADEKQHSP
jgi:multisubunit Na+/H+ antiporter MnhB subunit